MNRRVSFSFFAFLFLIAGGCAHIRPGAMEAVQPTSDAQRAGNVYLVRGWIGIFSFGMDQLSEKLTEQGIRCNVYQDAQTDELADQLVKTYRSHPNHEPIVLIGHSLGADDVVKLARALDEANVPVELLITVDPVMPDRIPKNVKLTCNYFRPNGSWDKLPMFRGIPVEQEVRGTGELRNIDLVNERPDLLEEKTNHFNIDKNPKVHQEVVKRVVATLPPRPRWLAMQAGTPVAARADDRPADADSARPAGGSAPRVTMHGETATHDPANFEPRAGLQHAPR